MSRFHRWRTVCTLCIVGLMAVTLLVVPQRGVDRAAAATTVTVTTTALPIATSGSAYSAMLSASGGIAPYTWSLLTGAVPTGLVLNSSGSLVGVPGPVGTFAIALRVSDSSGASTTVTLSLIVHPVPPIPQSVVIATSSGTVVTAGTAYGAPVVIHLLESPIAGVASSPTGFGSWVVTPDGQVEAVGDVISYGSLAPGRANQEVVGITANDNGTGYWIATSSGKVYGFGAARARGSIRRSELHGRVVGIAHAARGNGYYLVTTTGTVYGFGTARMFGSLAARRQHVQVAGISATPNAAGYWIATTSGRVYRYGAARQDRVTGPAPVGAVVSIATATTGVGYFLATTTGDIYSYGSALVVGPPAALVGGGVVGLSAAM